MDQAGEVSPSLQHPPGKGSRVFYQPPVGGWRCRGQSPLGVERVCRGHCPLSVGFKRKAYLIFKKKLQNDSVGGESRFPIDYQPHTGL